MQPVLFARSNANFSELVNHFRNADLVYAAAGEVELAIWRGDHVAHYTPPDGMGVGIEKVCVVGSKPMIRFGVRPVSTYLERNF